MRYNEEKITRLVSELNSAVRLLEEISAMSRKDIDSNPHILSSAKYNLMIAVEAVTDISNHIISKNNLRVPEDYADTFEVMQENKLIPKDFAIRLMQMARFRNRLVHLYWKVDTEVILNILQKDLNDFELFLKYLRDKVIE